MRSLALTTLVFLIWLRVDGQLSLYNTNLTMRVDQLQFDCFHYHIHTVSSPDQELSNHTFQTIPFCIRPINDNIIPISKFSGLHGSKYTFKDLRLAKIPAHQLLFWSAPIDLAELYQLYIDQPSTHLSLSEAPFFNCTQPWFGSLS